MTGMRSDPCENLYQQIHMRSGNFKYLCGCFHGLDKDEKVIQNENCPVGAWCPLVGDKTYYIVQEMKKT